jgi:hypothetical protein
VLVTSEALFGTWHREVFIGWRNIQLTVVIVVHVELELVGSVVVAAVNGSVMDAASSVSILRANVNHGASDMQMLTMDLEFADTGGVRHHRHLHGFVGVGMVLFLAWLDLLVDKI